MDICDLKKSDFENLPKRKWDEDIICDSIVIVPMDYNHDSGFKCMDIVAMVDDKPVMSCSGGCDVINLDGIGGYGDVCGNLELLRIRMIKQEKQIAGWCFDCLPCGYLRLFCNNKIKIGHSLSDLEIFAVEREE